MVDPYDLDTNLRHMNRRYVVGGSNSTSSQQTYKEVITQTFGFDVSAKISIKKSMFEEAFGITLSYLQSNQREISLVLAPGETVHLYVSDIASRTENAIYKKHKQVYSKAYGVYYNVELLESSDERYVEYNGIYLDYVKIN